MLMKKGPYLLYFNSTFPQLQGGVLPSLVLNLKYGACTRPITRVMLMYIKRHAVISHLMRHA